jgi:hypothetical protein
MQQYIEIGISSDSKEERIQTLKEKGFVLVDGNYPYGQWLYSAMDDSILIEKDNTLQTWFGYGTEMNEVGEIFIDFRTEEI